VLLLSVALFCWSVSVWVRSLWRLLSLSHSSVDDHRQVPSEGMWPTHIIGADCPVCSLPLVIAWREVAGRRHPWRINVEAITSCGCDSETMVKAIQEEME